jgi:antitoxin CcdA
MQDRARPRKKAVNLSIDAELVAEARAAGTNLSAVLESALREALRERRRKEWLEKNRAAITASNAELERKGAWYTPEWLAE